MEANMLKRTVVLRTYKRDENGIGVDGESIAVKLPVVWVKQKIAPQDIIDFLGDYTYDDTEWLLDEANKEGIEVKGYYNG